MPSRAWPPRSPLDPADLSRARRSFSTPPQPDRTPAQPPERGNPRPKPQAELRIRPEISKRQPGEMHSSSLRAPPSQRAPTPTERTDLIAALAALRAPRGPEPPSAPTK